MINDHAYKYASDDKFVALICMYYINVCRNKIKHLYIVMYISTGALINAFSGSTSEMRGRGALKYHSPILGQQIARKMAESQTFNKAINTS